MMGLSAINTSEETNMLWGYALGAPIYAARARPFIGKIKVSDGLQTGIGLGAVVMPLELLLEAQS